MTRNAQNWISLALRSCRALLGIGASAAVPMLSIWPAFAQTESNSKFVTAPPAEQYTLSPSGVDMRTGRYTYRQVDLSAGPDKDNPAFEFTRLETVGIPGHKAPFANMTHNWDVMLTQRRLNLMTGGAASVGATDFQIYVTRAGRTESFRAIDSVKAFHQISRSPLATLSHTGTRDAGGEIYTYTESDGSVVVFRPLGLIGASDCSEIVRCAYPSDITAPDGTKYTMQYETRSTGSRARLKSVTSSRGYAVLIDYDASNWELVTKACLYNVALSTLPSDLHCNSAAIATTSYSYTTYDSAPKLASVTDAKAAVWSFAYASGTLDTKSYQKMSYTKPGQSTPWLTNWLAPQKNIFLVDEDVTWRQDFGDGQSTSYNFDLTPTQFNLGIEDPDHLIAGGTYQNAAGTTTVQFGFPEVPYSATYHDPGMGTGQIVNYYFDDPMLGLTLGQQAQCNDCSGASGYQYQVAYQTTPGPVTYVDPLGRTSTFDYCDATVTLPQSEQFTCLVTGPLQSWTDPEGIKTVYKYSGTRIIEARRIAKPGSTLPDIVQTATFPTSCTSLKTCQKPLSVTDANGNAGTPSQHTTTYTYDANHGGVLTEVGPAVNGVSPAKKYSYSQFYAWVKNSSGTYIQASAPIWLVTEVRSCKTSALNLSTGACAAGTSDLVITSYDYGPASGPNNLWLRGVVITADGTSLRSCYGYDAFGHKISETSPRAALAGCQ